MIYVYLTCATQGAVQGEYSGIWGVSHSASKANLVSSLLYNQGNPLRPQGLTALAPARDRESPVGQRSSVPKIDTEGLIRSEP